MEFRFTKEDIERISMIFGQKVQEHDNRLTWQSDNTETKQNETNFVQSSGENISWMLAGKQCTCFMFANIRKEILNSDFNTLDPAVLMSAMQSSLTDSIFRRIKL